MIDLLKNIPLVHDVSISNGKGEITMKIENLHAKGYSCNFSLILAVHIMDYCDLSMETMHYISFLLAGHQNVHDFSWYLSEDKGWLCCVYEKNSGVAKMEKNIEIQLALARYLRYLIFVEKPTTR